MPDPVGGKFSTCPVHRQVENLPPQALEEAVMRPTQLTSLVLVGLLVSATSALAGTPSFRPPAPVRTGKSQVLQSWVVQGFGVEEKEAKQNALEEAKNQLLKYLNVQAMVLKWDPPLSYIESLAKHFEPAEDKEVPVAGHVKQLEIQVL